MNADGRVDRREGEVSISNSTTFGQRFGEKRKGQRGRPSALREGYRRAIVFHLTESDGLRAEISNP
jgi:hypothetical protein